MVRLQLPPSAPISNQNRMRCIIPIIILFFFSGCGEGHHITGKIISKKTYTIQESYWQGIGDGFNGFYVPVNKTIYLLDVVTFNSNEHSKSWTNEIQVPSETFHSFHNGDVYSQYVFFQ